MYIRELEHETGIQSGGWKYRVWGKWKFKDMVEDK